MSLEQISAVGRLGSVMSFSKPATPPLRVWSHSMIQFLWTLRLASCMVCSKALRRVLAEWSVCGPKKADAGVAQFHQMRYGGVDARRVVQQDGADLRVIQMEFGQ